ncbi:DUF4386 family protein [Paucibacter sp. APW11]|uniref:DUF4386 family protein n=1 Tax=Roseateles aquae TaxID=3077235 RepID=A0ABU3PB29_9BURK|nr:DUF4386 family protein [Paucibacter sp. APW11]MDT8999740.1 DUF4386 family protein [Paucibacter sp. APW11]
MTSTTLPPGSLPTPSTAPAPGAELLTSGRWLGVLMLLSFALGILSNFALQPLAWSQGGMLASAAAHGTALGGAVLMDLMLALIGLTISLLLRQRYGSTQPLLTMFCLAFSVAELTLCLVEGSSLVAMRTLSASYLAHPADASAYAPVAALLKALRNGFHYSGKAFGGLGLLLFFVQLSRARALPLWFAGLLLSATALQILTVALGFIGLDAPLLMLAPLGLLYPFSALWLLWRGLPRRA